MKISIARKNLFHEKIRFAISLGGVAFSVMLILLLLALYRGWNERLTEYVEEVDADVWVLQDGAFDMAHSFSLLPRSDEERIAEIEGVASVAPLLFRRVTLDVNGKEAKTAVIGFDTKKNVGGPLHLDEGEAIPQSSEIIIDRVFSKENGVNIGDTVTVADTPQTIVGIANGGPIFQYSFLDAADLRALFNMEEVANYFLASFEAGVDQQKVIEKIETALPHLDVQTKKEFADHNKQEAVEIFLPILAVLVVIGFIVGLVVISLTIYTATVEKSREYGVIKAIGASPRTLYRIVFEQSLISGVIGYGVGVVFTVAAGAIASRLEPLFVTSINSKDLVLVFGIVAVMMLLAAVVPIHQINRIDPAIVFKQ